MIKNNSSIDVADTDNSKITIENIKESRCSKSNYYLDIAEAVSKRSTCLRRKFGAVIVKDDEIISTGYNGAPRGRRNCDVIGKCIRETLNIPRGERYELCRSVHAEANAIISASRADMLDSNLYLVGIESNGKYVDHPCACSMCKRLIINAGIIAVYVRLTPSRWEMFNVSDWIRNDDSLDGTMGY